MNRYFSATSRAPYWNEPKKYMRAFHVQEKQRKYPERGVVGNHLEERRGECFQLDELDAHISHDGYQCP